MNKSLLTAVSAFAIMAAAPAMADTKVKAGASVDAEMETERTEGQSDIPEVTGEEIKQGWEDTKDAVSDTAKDISDATGKAYDDIKATFLSDDENADITSVTINEKMTAEGMIGQPVYNASGERVAKIHDIILDSNGDAKMVILADGDFTGLGKNVAFDYDVITQRSAEGDIVAPLTEEMIDAAAAFSYDPDDYSETVRIIPQNGYSVAELLDGDLVDTQGKKVGDVENISIRNGEADRIIVGFDKLLGLGGEKAALNYDAVDLVSKENKTHFKLSANQALKFETFKKQL